MPEVSVILPVYNAERYLAQAIDSILAQTFTNFELLLLNDGSTDASEAIILSYKDPRIIYKKNIRNEGLVVTLNQGVDDASGVYIARMDADDIASPERLAKQLEVIKNEPIDVIATCVSMIDEYGTMLPDWQADKKNITAVQIRRFLVWDNCIAHPSVLMRAALLKKFKYRPQQKYSEDYDLWLRLSAGGYVIAKLSEPLLSYRVLSSSQTRFKKINVFLRLALVKFRFAAYTIKNGGVNAYVVAAAAAGIIDLGKAAGKQLKSLLNK